MKINIDNFRIWAEKKNLLPKFISIVLAFILWGYLTSAKSGEVKFKLPVSYRNLDQNFTVSNPSNKFIMTRIRGRKDDLKNINSKNIKLFVDLSMVKEGEYNTYPVHVDKAELPEDVTVDLVPDEIKLYADKKVTRILPVMPKFTGETENDIVMGNVIITPDNIRLSGPGSIIDSIDAVYTGEIDLNNRISTFKTMVRLETISEGEVEYAFSDVSVTVPLFKISDTTLIDAPLTLRNRKKGYQYDAGYDKVKVRLLTQNNRDSVAANIAAYIDVAELQLSADDFTSGKSVEKDVPVRIRGLTPDEVISIIPEKVKLIITRE